MEEYVAFYNYYCLPQVTLWDEDFLNFYFID